jgi:hypothetical protein
MMILNQLKRVDGLGGFGLSIIIVRPILVSEAEIYRLTGILGILINSNISTYLTGSSLIALGLTWWQAIISIVIGNILATIFVILNSMPGSFYHRRQLIPQHAYLRIAEVPSSRISRRE